MKKLNIFILGSILLLVFLILLNWIIGSRGKTESTKITPTFTIPTISRLFTTSGKRLERTMSIVKTYPINGQREIPVSTSLEITFNQPLSNYRVEFSIAPLIPHKQTIKDNVLIITPEKPLQPGTTYTYSIDYPETDDFPQSFIFQTQGPTQKYTTDTQPVGGIPGNEDALKEDRPDIYVAAQLPYSNDFFSVSRTYIGEPNNRFTFVVQGKNSPEETKNQFTLWLKSLSLTTNQINKLSVTYK